MVKAASTASASSLLALVEKSGLLSDRLTEVQALAGSSGDARAFARQLVTKSLVTKWQAAQLLNGFYQFNLGKYRLLDQIGTGRIGREFLAEHVQLGKRVAIKLVSRNLTTDAERLKQFLAESRRAVSLDHPHLVHSMDVDQEGQRYYVVTEFVDGEDLKKRIARTGPCSPTEALSLIRQAAEGLQHAAVSGVLHGDLKPSNLLIDKQGSLKVADLGFARLVDAVPKAQQPQDSQEQNLQDGIEYYAPEALNATEGDMDCRADMYSLGQTLYFLLKGTSPPLAANSVDKRKACLGEPDVSPPIAAFFAGLTAPQAKDRPANWKEVLEQLRALDAKSANGSTTNGVVLPPVKRKPLVAQAITLSESEPVATVAVREDAEVAAADERPIIVTEDKSHARAKPADASADSAAKATARPLKSKKVDPKLVIGIAIGGGALLLLVSIGVLWMLLGRGQPEVAEAPKNKQAAKAEAEKTKAALVVDPEEETNPEKNPEPTVAPEASTSKPGEGEPKPPITNISSPQPAPDPKPEPKPEPESKPEPKPEPTATPQPTPTPEPPKPEPTPPQPVGKPFEKLPPTVSLPAVSKPGELFTLGELAIPAEKVLRILMHGGEGATRNKSVFTLQNANAETDERNWEVVLQKVVVAKMHREPDKLTFEWTADAAIQPAAGNLCNCLLQLNAGTDEHFMALRTPVEYDPETIDLEKGTKWNATVENLPSSTVVELVGLDPASFPNPDFKTETKGKSSKIEGQVMWYGDGLDTRNLGLLIDKRETGKRVDVSVAPVFRAETMAAQKLTKKLLPDLVRGLEQQLNVLTAASAVNDKSEASAEQKDQRRNLINADLQRGREQLDRVNKAVQLVTNAHDKAVLHIRVSYDTGAGKVVLAQTKGAPPPEPLGRKPAEKPEEKK